MFRKALISFIISLFICAAIATASTTPVRAAAQPVWNVAEQLRTALFDAQKALMLGTATATERALTDVDAAIARYQDVLAEPIREASPNVAAALTRDLTAARDALLAKQAEALAAARGAIWAELMHGGLDVTLAHLQAGDITAARDWLMLREFRKSTKFTRASAEATLALDAFAAKQIDVATTTTRVRNDLLDTYQARLDETLSDAEQAGRKNFTIKVAEYSAAAARYFEILSPAYTAQRGSDAAAQARAAFASFNRDQIAAALKGFRAVPLAEAELATRASQLMRFIPLIPIEYGRGVRDGKVIHDIEIQEALTFRDAAAAKFSEIATTLATIDPTATQKAETLLQTADEQIRTTADPAELTATINALTSTLTGLIPAPWLELNADADVDVVRSVLDQVSAAVKAGNYELAESARIEAYAVLDSGIEQKLRGFAPDLALEVESLFWQGTAETPGLAVVIPNRAPLAEVNRSLAKLYDALDRAHDALTVKSAPTAVAGNAAVIVFREGLEAVLILASLLASLRSTEHRKFRRPIVAGAALAFLASAVTWWAANGLLMSLIRFGERLEAIVSLIAIGVLLIITNWFFHKVYWTGWIATFHAKKGQLILGGMALGQVLGLVTLGFSSIYREGFETVLFLQSLVLDAGLGVVVQGVLLGLVGVAIVGVVTFAYQVRLPYKRMLIYTGIMIGAILLIMVGNTVHVLQAVGWLPITPIYGLYLPTWVGQWFGTYATWQGVCLQAAAAAFVIGSYFWAERINGQKRTVESRRVSTSNATT